MVSSKIEEKNYDEKVDYESIVQIAKQEESLKSLNRKDKRLSYWLSIRDNPGLNQLTDEEYFEYVRNLNAFQFKIKSGIKFLNQEDEIFLKNRDFDLQRAKSLLFISSFTLLFGLNILARKLLFYKVDRLYFRNYVNYIGVFGTSSYLISGVLVNKYADHYYGKKMFNLINNYS